MFRKSLQPNNAVDANKVLMLIEKLNATFHEISVSSDKSQILQVILAEYNALRTEIQNRSGIQSTILQIHITAITFILGGVLTQSFGQWLIFLIPIEATLFGLWWLDHSLVIMEIGTYLRLSVEPRVSKFLNQDKLLSWEADYKEGIIASNQKRNITFNWLVFITFAGPAMISLLYSLTLLILSILLENKYLPSSISSLVKVIYPGITVWVAASCLVINIVFFFIFISMFSHRIKNDYMIKAKKQQVSSTSR